MKIAECNKSTDRLRQIIEQAEDTRNNFRPPFWYREVAQWAIDEIERLRKISETLIKAAADNGRVFVDTADEIEERMKHDAENACPHCGGSGHKDDVSSIPENDCPDCGAGDDNHHSWTCKVGLHPDKKHSSVNGSKSDD